MPLDRIIVDNELKNKEYENKDLEGLRKKRIKNKDLEI